MGRPKRPVIFSRTRKRFRLGMLPTEMSHPKTASLSTTMAASTVDGVRMLMQVDEDIPPAMTRVAASAEFTLLVDSLVEALSTGKRVFFTGCGATGRLAILLEAAWRAFWQGTPYRAPRPGFPAAESGGERRQRDGGGATTR